MKNKIDQTVRDYAKLEKQHAEGLKKINEELISSNFLTEVVHGITNNKDDNEAILQAVIGIFMMACLFRDTYPHHELVFKDLTTFKKFDPTDQ